MGQVIEVKITADPALIAAINGLAAAATKGSGAAAVASDAGQTAGKNKGGRPRKEAVQTAAEELPDETPEETEEQTPDEDEDLGLPGDEPKTKVVANTKPKYTADDVVGALTKYRDKHGAAKAKELLTKFHAKTWQALDAKHYDDFMKLCK